MNAAEIHLKTTRQQKVKRSRKSKITVCQSCVCDERSHRCSIHVKEWASLVPVWEDIIAFLLRSNCYYWT